MSVKLHVLIPDGGSTWAATVLSCLSRNSRYKFFVLSNIRRTATRYSKYTSYYKYYPRPADHEWQEIVSKEIRDNDISIVVPIAEKEIRFFIANREHFQSFTRIIPLPDQTSFETAIDKYQLSQFLKANDIAHPKSFLVQEALEIEPKSFPLQFPVLSKPLHDKGGDGIVKIEDLNALKHLVETRSDDDHFVQEYIDGYDIDCSVICNSGKILAYTIQKGNLPGHSPYAPQLAFHFLKNDDLYQTVEKAMKTLNWSGVAHIDLRYDEQTGDYKLIEINARFWGSIDGSRVAGINFPDLAIKLVLNEPIDEPAYRAIEYMRLKGVLKSIKRKPSLLFRSKFLFENTEVSSFFRDPLPVGFKFIEWFNRRFTTT